MISRMPSDMVAGLGVAPDICSMVIAMFSPRLRYGCVSLGHITAHDDGFCKAHGRMSCAIGYGGVMKRLRQPAGAVIFACMTLLVQTQIRAGLINRTIPGGRPDRWAGNVLHSWTDRVLYISSGKWRVRQFNVSLERKADGSCLLADR
jgi:hypothetical protein